MCGGMCDKRALVGDNKAARLFFSYSHKDEALRDQLEVHLAMLKRERVLETWHDRRIVAGSELDPVIREELDRADVIFSRQLGLPGLGLLLRERGRTRITTTRATLGTRDSRDPTSMRMAPDAVCSAASDSD